MEKESLKNYHGKKDKILSRLADFKNLQETEYFKEFLFCLLTPQSNAKKCWQAVLEMCSLKYFSEENILNILKTKTRFHKTKTLRILKAEETWREIKPHLNDINRQELRNFIAENVNGYGLKEASHFLRNIGKSDNQIAILDRHILKNLRSLNLIPNKKIKSKKNYFEIEKTFLNFAKSKNILPDELDLLWWSNENGEIFK